MSESMTNLRRHGSDLPIRDHDLVTGRDVRKITATDAASTRAWAYEQLMAERVLWEHAIAQAILSERRRVANLKRWWQVWR